MAFIPTISEGVTGKNQIIDSGGKQVVYGLAYESTITDALQYIEKNGKAYKTTISSGGIQRITCGVASNTTINFEGYQSLNGDTDIIAKSIDTVVHSGGSQKLHAYSYASNTIIDGGIQTVHIGASAVKTIINAGGSQILSGGSFGTTTGNAINTTVSSGGRMQVYASCLASSANILSGGVITIESGGIISATTVFPGGTIVALRSSVVRDTVVSSGGDINISQDAVASGTRLDGGTEIIGEVLYYGGGGSAVSTTVNTGGRQLIYDGSAINTTVNNGGYVYVGESVELQLGDLEYNGWSYNMLDSGRLASVTVYSGDIEVAKVSDYQVLGSGRLVSATIHSGGNVVVEGGMTSATVVSSGGRLVVNGNNWVGFASETQALDGGRIEVGVGGVTSSTVVSGGGRQTVSGGTAYKTKVLAFGWQCVESSGIASDTIVSASGVQFVSAGGKASKGVIKKDGLQFVSGGIAVSTTVNKGGLQRIASACSLISSYADSSNRLVYSDDSEAFTDVIPDLFGSATDTKILAGGSQLVEEGGIANNAIVDGLQIVDEGGIALNTIVNKGGTQKVWGHAQGGTLSSGNVLVMEDGLVRSLIVLDGGLLKISEGGMARAATVSKGGKLVANAGARVSAVTLKTGAMMSIASGNTLCGANSFTGATIVGGKTKNRVALAKTATLSVGAKTNMAKLHLNVGKAALTVTGAGNTLGSIAFTENAKVTYDISKLAAKGITRMLSVTSTNIQQKGQFSVIVAKKQAIGTYELSSNIIQDTGTAYTVNLGTNKLGALKLGSGSLTKNGVTYKLKNSDAQINLTIAIKPGKMLKGTTGKDKLSGNAHSDIFYGGKGNDTITGKNGRDVAVYDKTAWGKDTIAKTSGTMTLLFKDLTSKDIKKSLSGTTMTIIKANDAKQKITVKGWSDDTHYIVFGSKMTAFDKYIKATSPTTAQTTAARNEAFKKAGLASA